MTLDSVRRSDAVRRTATLVVPPDDVNAVHTLLDDVWAEAPHIPTLDRIRFATALIELSGNVVEYATARGAIDCRVEITVTPDRMQAVILDSGVHNSLELDGAREMPDEFSESGRGLAMIQALVDAFTYERVGDVNRWQIVSTPKP